MLLPLGQRRSLSSFMSVLNDNNVAEFTVGGLRTIKAIKKLCFFSLTSFYYAVYYYFSKVRIFYSKNYYNKDIFRSLVVVILLLFSSHDFWILTRSKTNQSARPIGQVAHFSQSHYEIWPRSTSTLLLFCPHPLLWINSRILNAPRKGSRMLSSSTSTLAPFLEMKSFQKWVLLLSCW